MRDAQSLSQNGVLSDLSEQAGPQPNFFLVGTSKAGTTSLHNYLAQHPQIYMSPIKEPHFFADEVRATNFAEDKREVIAQWQTALRDYLQGPVSERFPSGPVENWQDYLKLFERAGGRPAIGESSPCYLWSKTAPGNIVSRCPNAKIIIVLRDPAERAFSQHLHTLSFAAAPISFREHIDAALRSTTTRIGELYPFLEFGNYSQQIRRYFDHLERERIRVFFYEDYLSDPCTVLRDIFKFLDVDENFAPDMRERHMEPRVPRWFGFNRFLRQDRLQRTLRHRVPAGLRRSLRTTVFRPRNTLLPDPQDRARLVAFYDADIRGVATLLDRDLSSWLDRAPPKK